MVLSSLFHKKTTKPILKNKKYELVHPFKCRIAKLAKSVFKILAFTFLYEIGYFSAKTAGDATICTNLNSTYKYKDALCAKAKNFVQPFQRRRCLKF